MGWGGDGWGWGEEDMICHHAIRARERERTPGGGELPEL